MTTQIDPTLTTRTQIDSALTPTTTSIADKTAERSKSKDGIVSISEKDITDPNKKVEKKKSKKNITPKNRLDEFNKDSLLMKSIAKRIRLNVRTSYPLVDHMEIQKRCLEAYKETRKELNKPPLNDEITEEDFPADVSTYASS